MDKEMRERLEEVCGKRGIEVARAELLCGGNVFYKDRLKTIFVGEYISDNVINLLCNTLCNRKDF